jgi:peroxiredoxin
MCCAKTLTFTIVGFNLFACVGQIRGQSLVTQVPGAVAQDVVSQNAAGASQVRPLDAQPITHDSKPKALASMVPATNPPAIRSVKGVLNATLKLINARNRIAKTDGSGDADKRVLPSRKLDREDRAMTQLLRVPPKRPDSENNAAVSAGDGADKAFRAAPYWKIPDAMGSIHDIGEFAGQPLIIVFYRGMGCLHCVDQLSLFATHKRAVEQAGVKLVAIGSDSKEKLRKSLASYGDGDRAPFLFLADPNQDVFKRYGCFRSEPMHGIFLIDVGGRVRWQNIAESPFMDIDQIISRSRKLRGE